MIQTLLPFVWQSFRRPQDIPNCMEGATPEVRLGLSAGTVTWCCVFHTDTHACTCMRTYTCTHACMYTHTHMLTYTYPSHNKHRCTPPPHVHAPPPPHTCMLAHTHTHARMHACAHAHTHTPHASYLFKNLMPFSLCSSHIVCLFLMTEERLDELKVIFLEEEIKELKHALRETRNKNTYIQQLLEQSEEARKRQ